MPSIEALLTPRLKAVAAAVPRCKTVCDIGTDHAYVPIYLVKNGIADRCIAADIKKGPLAAARSNILRFGVESKVETRLSDGFAAFSPDEADVAVIAGMGGDTIAEILKKNVRIAKFVLQPQSAHARLRYFLQKNGYAIKREYLAKEGDKLYTAMYVERGAMPPLSETEAQIGPCLVKERPPLFEEYVRYRLYELEAALSQMERFPSAKEKRSEYSVLKKAYLKLINRIPDETE